MKTERSHVKLKRYLPNRFAYCKDIPENVRVPADNCNDEPDHSNTSVDLDNDRGDSSNDLPQVKIAPDIVKLRALVVEIRGLSVIRRQGTDVPCANNSPSIMPI
jgi:hypothetical protein